LIKNIQNIYLYSFFNFVDKILIFLLPLIILKIYDDKNLYNSIEYIYSIAIIIVIFFDLGLKNYTFYFLKHSKYLNEDIKKIENTFYFFLILLSLFLFSSFSFFKNFYNEILIFIFVRIIYLTIINFYKIYFRAKDKPSKIFIFSIPVSILTIVLMIWNFLFLSGNSLFIFFVFQILLILFYFLIKIKNINKFKSNIKNYITILKKSFYFSYPLMLSILFYNFMLNYGKIYSFNFLSDEEMSFLSLVQRIFIILTFFHATYVSYFQKKIFISDDKFINKKIFIDYFKIIILISVSLLILTPFMASYVKIEILNFNIVILLFLHSILWCISSFFDMYLTKTNNNKSILFSMLFSLLIFVGILFSFQNNFLLIFCLALNISTLIYLFLIIFKIKRIDINFN
jgi:O-antigen/teichoic acid export membrane protein